MFHRNSGDEIAKALYKSLGEGLEKKAAHADARPEDFLVEESEEDVSAALDSALDSLDSTDDDKSEDSAVELPEDVDAERDLQPDLGLEADNLYDYDLLPDSSAMFLMSGLGKIAAGLRSRNEGFAADMVEATAMSIRGDLIKEAQEKQENIDSLKKMAKELDDKSDVYAADLIRATIKKITGQL